MSLIQIQKRLGLEDISPKWASVLTAFKEKGEQAGFDLLAKYKLDSGLSWCCIVGEAHGDDRYTNCGECSAFSFDGLEDGGGAFLGWNGISGYKSKYLDHIDIFDKRIAEFVEHFNTAHLNGSS